jgi:hypothetical protein
MGITLQAGVIAGPADWRDTRRQVGPRDAQRRVKRTENRLRVPGDPSPMKLATWNVNSLAVRLPQVLDWLGANPTDVLVLQETKLTDDKFPHAEFTAAGYAVQWFGQKTYNGVALISRAPALDVVKNIPGLGDEQARVIAGTVAGVRCIGAYFPNGQAPDSDKFVYKMRWLTRCASGWAPNWPPTRTWC